MRASGPPSLRHAGTIGMRAIRRSLHRAAAVRSASLPLGDGRARRALRGRACCDFTADSFDETIEGINAVAASGNPLAATVIGALQEGRLLFSAQEQARFHSRAVRPTDRRRDGRACRRQRARRSRAGAPQQPPAPHRRGGARQLDVDGARSGQAPRGGAGRVQIERCECAPGARPGDCQGDRCPGQAGVDRGARGGRALSRQRIGCRQDRRRLP